MRLIVDDHQLDCDLVSCFHVVWLGHKLGSLLPRTAIASERSNALPLTTSIVDVEFFKDTTRSVTRLKIVTISGHTRG